MSTPLVRPMTHADVVPAADLLRRGAWGERETFFRYALAEPWVRPLVAERDEAIVGTGVASAHGPVGWVGTIFVDQAERGRGVGRALTQATMAELRDLGCSTLVLVATEMGRQLYEQLGFETRTFYQTFELEGRALADGEPPLPGIGAFAASHAKEAAALDARATGEDRRGVLRAMSATEGGLACSSRDGVLQGFILRGPWGGGATVATSHGAAMGLLEARRLRAGPDHLIRAGTPIENEAGVAALVGAGWRPTYRARRMELGPRPDWRPDWLWGQFNMAIG